MSREDPSEADQSVDSPSRGESSNGLQAVRGESPHLTDGGAEMKQPADPRGTPDASFDEPSESVLERVINRIASAIDSVQSGGQKGESWINRVAYAQFAGWYRQRHDRFETYRRRVNQARLSEPYDRLLALATMWTLVFAVVGSLLGVLIALIITGQLGFTGGRLWSPIRVPPSMPDVLLYVIDVVSEPAIYLMLSVGGALFLGGSIAAAFWYYPRFRAYERQREIRLLLPQAVMKMYAISQGNTTFPAIVESLADDEVIYGEVARSFQAVQNNMEFFGVDLRTALWEAREATPSDELAELFDDMISILDSGGALTPFLRNKTEEYQEWARRQKDDLLETLGFLAEAYVTVGVVSVLMVVVMLTVFTAISGSGLLQLRVVVYFGIPAVTLGMIIAVDTAIADETGMAATLPTNRYRISPEDIEARLNGQAGSSPETAQSGRLEDVEDPPGVGPFVATTGSAVPSVDGGQTHAAMQGGGDRGTDHSSALEPSERAGLSQLRDALIRKRIVDQLKAPIDAMRERPILSLIATIPVAIGLVIGLALTGISVPTPRGFLTTPIWTTTLSVVVPTIIVLVPLSYFHERRRLRNRRVSKELPDVLRKLASAHESGMTFAETIALVGEASEGYLASELRKVDHELSNTNVSLEESLVRLANRVRHPRLTRVLKLLIEANMSGGRVREVLAVAADDTKIAHRLERERRRDMMLYKGIILMGNGVFLLVALTIVIMLLPTLAETASSVQSAQPATQTGGSIPGMSAAGQLTELKMLLFHGTLLQAFCTGLLAGKFSDGDSLTGTKFAIGQLLVTVLVFIIA